MRLVRLLVGFGADFRVVNEVGNGLVMVARLNRDHDMVDYFVEMEGGSS